mmetsp:Transcript_100549/g.322715  ORF Transcript_100549/g.322715 Transcript_100549/m.322715 type:complete len:265 (-) Transcript_100549:25-819(-)
MQRLGLLFLHLDPVVLPSERVARLEHAVRRQQHKRLDRLAQLREHLYFLVPSGVVGIEGLTQKQGQPHAVGLGHRMLQHCDLVLQAGDGTGHLELGHDWLQMQHRPPPRGAVQKPEVAAGDGIVGPNRWVLNQDDAMSRIAKQRQQTPTLMVEAVAWAANLCCPCQLHVVLFAGANRFAFVQWVLKLVELKPSLALLLGETLQLEAASLVDPLAEVALDHMSRDIADQRPHVFGEAGNVVVAAGDIALVQRTEGHQKFCLQRNP